MYGITKVKKGISTNQAGPSHFITPVTVWFKINLPIMISHHPRVTKAWLHVSCAAFSGVILVRPTQR